MKLILASGSKYRKALFEERGLSVLALAPKIDEDALKNSYFQEAEAQGTKVSPQSLGLRLAQAKAESIFKDHPEDIVIGSDQICAGEDHKIFNKPGNRTTNIERLMDLQGKTHYLYTCTYIIGPSNKVFFTDTTQLEMKALSLKEIKTYVDLDQAYDCAGGYKYESHGHKLFSHVQCQDPSAIQGLPMRQTLEVLKKDFKWAF